MSDRSRKRVVWHGPRRKTKRIPTLVVEPEQYIQKDRTFGELPDLVALWRRIERDGLSDTVRLPVAIAALLRRTSEKGTVYWIRVYAVPIFDMKFRIYRQVGANRSNSGPRIMCAGIATCPGLTGNKDE